MMLIKSESRNQANYLDTLLDETRTNLTSLPTMQKYLGETAVKMLLTYLDTVHIADKKHGVVNVPKQDKRLGIPIIMTTPGERLRYGKGFESPTAIQRDRIVNVFENWGISQAVIAELDDGFASGTQTNLLRVPASAKIRGFNTGNNILFTPQANTEKMGKSQERVILGRPVICIMDHPEKFSVHRSSTLVHELRHAIQWQSHPIRAAVTDKFSDSKLRDELDAYYYGASYEMALYNSEDERYSGNPDVLNDVFIERIRGENMVNANDPFRPSGTVAKALRDCGLDDIY